jgi:transposase-like protein
MHQRPPDNPTSSPQRSAIQLFPDLEPDVEAALRASIARFGVIIPIVKDQDGRILDGNHRARIAADLGLFPDEIIVKVADEAEAREYARTLNADRRHLTPDQRRAVVGTLREQGHSLRAIAGAVGVSEPTVRRDVDKAIASGDAIQPDRVVRAGGGTYPAARPPGLSAPAENQRRYEATRKAKKVGVVVAGNQAHDLYELIDWVSRLDALHTTDEYAADIEPRRRATTAKRLRKAGMFFGAIAWALERKADEPVVEGSRP